MFCLLYIDLNATTHNSFIHPVLHKEKIALFLLLYRLVEMAKTTEFFWVDDAYVTGMLGRYMVSR